MLKKEYIRNKKREIKGQKINDECKDRHRLNSHI